MLLIISLKVLNSFILPFRGLYLMLYFSLSHFVYIISEGWKQFSKVGDVSLDKAKRNHFSLPI